MLLKIAERSSARVAHPPFLALWSSRSLVSVAGNVSATDGAHEA
jgi:hypothetical protein